MTSLYPALTCTYLSGISVQKPDIIDCYHMNSNWTIPVPTSDLIIQQLLVAQPICFQFSSSPQLLQHNESDSFCFQLLQTMPRCYEVPPTLWRPNSFFRVRWAPYGPALAPTLHSPVNASRCEASKWSDRSVNVKWGSKYVSLPLKCLK